MLCKIPPTFGTRKLQRGISIRTPARYLHLHEYQSKELMNKFGISTQKWGLATTPEEAESVAKNLGPGVVVKAQIHAGGRGLGVFDNGFKGGVQIVQSPEQAREAAKNMLGARLITKQTPPDGVLVSKVLVEKQVKIASSGNQRKEFYFAILMDRGTYGPVFVASTQGGVDIEKVAENTPNLIFKEPIDIFTGPTKEQTRRLAEKLGFSGDGISKFQEKAEKLYDLFIKTDATQVEINPLAVLDDGEVCVLDAKLNFDDNADFRQKKLFEYSDPAELDPRELTAAKWGLSYVPMDGNIGCMVNGAGLAMATMDIIKLYHGAPANFLDVGGGADEQRVAEAFKIITTDPKVKAILVNIFGGIVKCDMIAQGIINAYKSIGLNLPIVVRLAGTNVEQGYKLLKESGLKMITANTLEEAAIKATQCLKH